MESEQGSMGAVVSDGIGAPSLSVPSATGWYITLAREGKLERLAASWKEYTRLCAEQSSVQQALDDSSSREWLLDLQTRIQRRGKKFEPSLRQHIDQLEQQKEAINRRLATIRNEITAIDPQVLGNATPAPIATGLVFPRSLVQAITSQTDIGVFLRDLSILKYGQLPDRVICHKLDVEPVLIRSDGPPLGLPESWQEKYGVKSYLAAYDHLECRKLVQKMISVAKERFRALP